MDQVVFSVPSMWADHHTLAVREMLAGVAGVDDVIASSLYTQVRVKFEPSVTSPEALATALANAGYEVGVELALPHHLARIDDESDWFQFQERITETDRRDLVMSGDHRMY